MSVFDRVVVGVDGTDFGFEALHQALALSPNGASTLAVTALDTAIAGYAGFQMNHFIAQFEEEAGRARAKAVEIMGDRPNCTTEVVRGDAKRVLRHACEEYDATLLALGGRSSSRFLGMLTGETAGTLLHEAARSVLIARPRWAERWHLNRIVVGLDGSESSLAALAVADDLAERLGSALEVVTCDGREGCRTRGRMGRTRHRVGSGASVRRPSRPLSAGRSCDPRVARSSWCPRTRKRERACCPSCALLCAHHSSDATNLTQRPCARRSIEWSASLADAEIGRSEP